VGTVFHEDSELNNLTVYVYCKIHIMISKRERNSNIKRKAASTNHTFKLADVERIRPLRLPI
jgi:hypothetical protein